MNLRKQSEHRRNSIVGKPENRRNSLLNIDEKDKKTLENRRNSLVNLEEYPQLNRGELEELKETFKRKN